MKRVYGDEFRIESEDEFSLECAYARAVLDRAEEEGRGDQLQWFFQEAYVNFKASTATAIFGSYNLPEYKGFGLSVSVSKQPDDSWKCAVIKKIMSKEQS